MKSVAHGTGRGIFPGPLPPGLNRPQGRVSENPMKNGKRQGFTLLELVVVIAILAVFIPLTFPPLISALQVVGLESAMLNMDQSANRALNAVTAELRPAILPININNKNDDDVTVSDTLLVSKIQGHLDEMLSPPSLDQFMNNAAAGFGVNGTDWLDVLEKGTDFLPFTIPVALDYGDGTSSVTTIDSAMLPQLGILIGDTPLSAANYAVETITTVDGAESRTRYLWPNSVGGIGDVRPIHPSLAALDPGDLDFDGGDTVDLSSSRFAENLTLPEIGRAHV
jgi:prepilin-type N-terminal cleavage/methylation domain-containing protein